VATLAPGNRPRDPGVLLHESAKGFDLKLIASLQPGAKSLKSVLAQFRASQGRAPLNVLWLIGPEETSRRRRWTVADERVRADNARPLVLRCETAAVYALSVLSYELSG